MDKSLHVQHQIRENAEELQDYLKDLMSWEKEMKVKEEEIKKRAHDDTVLPPIRATSSGKKKKKKDKKGDVAKERAKKSKEEKESKAERIPGHDYRAWDLFNVDEALKDLDEQEKEAGKKSSSEEEESEESENDVYEWEKRKQLALIEKDKGNEFFKKGNYDMAISCYTTGIGHDPTNALLLANRAMALIKKGQLAAAELDCSKSLSLDPTYVKAYLRRGTARLGLRMYEEAKQDFCKVLDLEPDNNQAKLELERLQKEILLAKNKINVDCTESEKTENKFIEELENSKEQDTILESKNKLNTSAHQPSNIHNPTGSEKLISSNKSDDRLQKLFKPEDKDSCIIKPIQKPPHLRSQKPMKRIAIKDVSGIAKCVSSTDDGKQISVLDTSELHTEDNILKERTLEECGEASPAPTICSVEDKNPSVLQNTNDSSMNVEYSDYSSESSSKSAEIITPVLSVLPSLPSVPVTSYQFLADWKKMKNHPDLLYEYVKQFPPEKLPIVFKQSIDTELFCGILQTLSTKFVEKYEDVFPYLNNLRKVGRFNTLVMFLAEEEVKALNCLFQSVRSNQKYPPEEIQNVEKDYGLS